MIFFCCCCSVLFGSTRVLCTILSLVTGHPVSTGNRLSNGMGLKLNQILVDHAHKFCVAIAPALAGRRDCMWRVLWLDQCPGFSFHNLQSTLVQQKDEKARVKTPPTPSRPPYFQRSVQQLFLAVGPAFSFQWVTLILQMYLLVVTNCKLNRLKINIDVY